MNRSIILHAALWLILCPCLLQAHSGVTKSLNGSDWMLQRVLDEKATPEQISAVGFDDSAWTPGKVPGTVLTSFLETGQWPDPNYGDGQMAISEEYFTADFWYRKEFTVSTPDVSQMTWLNFDGINWKARVYLNSHHICDINGAFRRTSVNISEHIRPGENALAIHIIMNENPGEVTVQHLNDPDGNGGIIGKDSPTFLASIGWNWMPTIRGRNTGIWNDVYLRHTGDITIEDPFVTTVMDLPDTTSADISLKLSLANHSTSKTDGSLVVEFDGKCFSYPVSLPAGRSVPLTLTPQQCKELRLHDPRLWWPNGYGEQNLYSMKLRFECSDGSISDSKDITFGVREYSYEIRNDKLRISINGFPLIVRGGNWGMPESMLRCDSLGYDLRVKLHKQMNLNMIRNWIGMTGDDEFYEACDKYGLMVWDDFWIANPVDGPDPDDEEMFLECAADKIRHFRNHPCIAIWCGRNEGFPPATLDQAMHILTHQLDGTRYYIPHSASSPVSGLGPYENKSPEWYFTNRGRTFHSEQGIVVPPTLEGFKAMMSEEDLWPVNDMWGLHDWTQERVQIYYDDMTAHYGLPTGIEDFCRKAQMMNMEACKALMESWQSNRGPGVMVWMSHPAWPSLICQTYDYFFEPTAAFFAFRTANEPVHILMRPDNNDIELVNDTRRSWSGLKASVKIVDLQGRALWSKEYCVDINAGSKMKLDRFQPDTDCPEIYLVSLHVTDWNGEIVSRNFYWKTRDGQDYRAMNQMSQAQLSCSVRENGDGSVVCEITNTGNIPALMLRLIVLDKKSSTRVLPIFYEDNYISLLPGESRRITVSAERSFDRKKDIFQIEGWNYTRHNINNKRL